MKTKFRVISLLLMLLPLQLGYSQNYALSFNGSTGSVSLPSTLWNNNFSNGTAITVEYWFKGSTMNSVYRVQSSPDGGKWFVAGYYPDTHIISTDGGVSGINAGTYSTITNGNWHHLAFSWTKGGYFTSYFDGVQVAQRSAADVYLPDMNVTNYLGAWGTVNAEYLNGSLDEIRIWNTVRTATEINCNRSTELTGNESGLVAYYKMSDASGTTLTDNTGHGYGGTLNSGITWANGPTLYATPTIQASGLNYSNVTATSATLSWTNGNGSNRVVFMKSINSEMPTTVNATTYTANAVFGSGTQIGTSGWYCVYNGTSNSVTVSNLTTTSPYNVMVLEYNGVAGAEIYQTAGATNNPLALSTIYSPKNCLSFNGSSSYLETPNSAAFQPTGGEFTFETWVNMTSSATTTGTLLFNLPNWAAKGYEFKATYDATTTLYGVWTHFWINGTEVSFSTPPCINRGVWNHIAITWSNTAHKSSIYVNGVLQAEVTTTNATYVDNGYGPEIGRSYRRELPSQGNWEYINGKMEEIRFWSVCRTMDQIRAGMCRPLMGNETGLAAYYKFDETNGTTAVDLVGAKNASCYNTTIASSTVFNTWLNTGSTDWATATNWGLGTVPVSTDNVAVYHAVSSTLPAFIGAGSLNNFILDNSAAMSLTSNLSLTGNLVLESNLDLNAKTITLGTTGNLAEGSGILSGATGSITTTRNLNNISALNVAGLGATLTTTANMGSTTFTRTHSEAGGTLPGSILRKYNIVPTTNTGLNATLVFNYLDSELNGLSASSLKLVKSTDSGATWTLQGGTLNTSSRTATLSGINSFSIWTLANLLVPALTTQAASNISTTTATGNGNITDLGFPNPTAYGVCWNTTGTPTISDSKVSNGAVSATGAFSSSISGLTQGTLYYVRAYATNSAGTSYGSQVNFVYSNGDITSSQIVDPTNSDIVVNTGTTFTCSGDNQNYHSVTVLPGGKLTLADTKSLTAGTLILQSDATGTGTFVDNNSGASPPAITASVNQYLNSGRNWYMSSPITNAGPGVLNGTSVVYYDEPTAVWVAKSSGTLNSMQGFISVNTNVAGSVTFTGTLNNGSKSIVLTRTEGVNKSGFNLVGNPYPSYLNAMTAINANSNLSKTVWYRTRSTGTTPTYYFETVNTTSGIGTNNSGTGAVTGFIPPMQAFWVRATANTTLSFDNTMRSHSTGSTTLLKAPSVQTGIQRLVRLQVSNGINNDEAVVYFNPNASDGYDNYDSPKVSNANAAIPEIYTVAGAERLTINGLNEISDNLIPLGFNNSQSGTNSFTISCTEMSNFGLNVKLYLRDNFTGDIVPLTVGESYEFSSEKYNDSQRFDIINNTSISTGIDKLSDCNEVKVFVKNGNIINIKTTQRNSSIETCKVTDVQGRVLYSYHVNKPEFEINANLPAGLYLLTSKTNEFTYTNKIILK